MEWWLVLILIFGGLFLLFCIGLPVAFSFILINIVGFSLFFGVDTGLTQLVLNMYKSMSRITLLPIPLFVLMGELLFNSRIAQDMMNAIDCWLGRLPGRLSLLAIGSGTLLGALSGQSMATTAMLGEALVPEMEKFGYQKPMTLGPILGSGGLAVMIPPSTLAVFLASLTNVSVGSLLMAGIGPGIMMAVLYSVYTVARSIIQPELAPSYKVAPKPLSEKLVLTAKYLLPSGFVILAVTGVIFLGIATPTEAAATGCLSTFILVAAYKKLTWKMLKKSLWGTVNITGMIFFIIAGSVAFSQILAYSGATREMAELVVNLPVSNVILVLLMCLILIVLGMLIGVVSMVMITMPIFMPIIQTLGIDALWFSVLVLLTMEMGGTSPPFGLNLFAMKGAVKSDTTMGDIYRAAMPYLYCDLVVLLVLLFFPLLALWIPYNLSPH